MAGSQNLTTKVWQQFQDLVVESARTQVRLSRQYLEATQRLGRDGWADRDLLRRLQTEGERYLRELTELNMRHARAVQDLVRDSGERVLDITTGSSTADGHRHDVRLALDVAGPLGGRASGTFTVANTREHAVRVSFEAGPLHAVAGDGAAIRPSVAFDPAGLDLAAGTESVVGITVDLDDATLSAGRTYRGEVRVVGGDVVLELTVRVAEAETRARPPAPSAAAEPAARPPDGPRAKKPAAKKASAKRTTAAKPAAKKSSRKTATRSAGARRTPPAQG